MYPSPVVRAEGVIPALPRIGMAPPQMIPIIRRLPAIPLINRDPPAMIPIRQKIPAIPLINRDPPAMIPVRRKIPATPLKNRVPSPMVPSRNGMPLAAHNAQGAQPHNQYEMKARDYMIVMELGRGGFGVVYRVLHKGGTTYAMKKLKVSANSDPIIKEFAALLYLKGHPNIVQYIDYFIEISYVCIVMEFCNLGNLENHVIKFSPMNEVLLMFMKQMADGIRYSHRKGIVHRDLKPENVLITLNNGELIAKIADFGIAKFKPTCSISVPRHGLPLVSYMHTLAGTSFYMAPEVFNGNYTEKADVFSLGIMFCAILEREIRHEPGHGKRLVIFFGDYHQEPVGQYLHANPVATRYLKLKVAITFEIRRLINSMIKSLYIYRPSAEEVHRALQLAVPNHRII